MQNWRYSTDGFGWFLVGSAEPGWKNGPRTYVKVAYLSYAKTTSVLQIREWSDSGGWGQAKSS